MFNNYKQNFINFIFFCDPLSTIKTEKSSKINGFCDFVLSAAKCAAGEPLLPTRIIIREIRMTAAKNGKFLHEFHGEENCCVT
jgi:hypothetical protein